MYGQDMNTEKSDKNDSVKGNGENTPAKKKSKRNKGKVFFDEEVVTKGSARNLTKKDHETSDANTSINSSEKNVKQQTKVNGKSQKKKKRKLTESNNMSPIEPPSGQTKKPKRNHNEQSGEVEKEESIRARKRRKHLKLVAEKKLQSELSMQQKCLNYLSQWQHNRQSWKFEKLKQQWLLHSAFDEAKVPEEFWDITVEYFNNSKGRVKDILVKEALKIIEKPDGDGEDEMDLKYKRARHIVQNLQE